MKQYLKLVSVGLVTLSLISVTDIHAHGLEEHTMEAATHEDIDQAPTLEQRSIMLRAATATGVGSNPNFTVSLDSETATKGRWHEPFEWPLVGVFNSLLSDGRVLSFDSAIYENDVSAREHTFTRATVWDPVTNTHIRENVETGHNLFCSGFSSLPDGRMFFAAGNLPGSNSKPETHVFNPITNAWAQTQTMQSARWYPGVTPLANGETLITGGRVGKPEVRQLDGLIRRLSNVDEPYWRNSWYPWLQTAPNGKVAFFGPSPQMGYVSTGGKGHWQSTARRDNSTRHYGSYAMYDIGKILVAGGGTESNTFTQRSTRVIDLAAQTSVPSGNMIQRRRQHDLTVLADGSVLATGGFASNASLIDLNNATYQSELWNPQTGQWSAVASEASARLYHSSTLLLPDGRVLSTGGGVCGHCTNVGYYMKDAQIFSPPYLFEKDGSGNLANRPTIVSTPSELSHNETFNVSVSSTQDIQKVVFIRTGTSTHSQNTEQRYIPLTFSKLNAETLRVESPINENIAPPGHYMLFVIDASGVPSISTIIKVVNNEILIDPLLLGFENLAPGSSATQSSTYSLRASASNAIDGSSNGTYNNGSITHTNYQNEAWLHIDLGYQREIDRIRLFNRTDCCSNRLSNFHVFLSSTPFTSLSVTDTLKQRGVSEYYFENPIAASKEFSVDRKARYVRVQLAGSGYLSLAEVQVWGDRSFYLSPNTLGSGDLPSGYERIDFTLADSNWTRDLSLPQNPKNGDQVIVSSTATWSSILHANNIDFPLNSMVISKNDDFTFTYNSTTGKWLVGGEDVAWLSPNNSGNTIADNPKRITYYSLSNGNWTKNIKLPQTARTGDVIVVRNAAHWQTNVTKTYQQYNQDINIRNGEQVSFQFNAACGCWQWIIDENQGLNYTANQLVNGNISALRQPHARVNSWNGNYKRKIYLPTPSGVSARIEVSSSADFSFQVFGLENDISKFTNVHRGERKVFEVHTDGKWKLR